MVLPHLRLVLCLIVRRYLKGVQCRDTFCKGSSAADAIHHLTWGWLFGGGMVLIEISVVVVLQDPVFGRVNVEQLVVFKILVNSAALRRLESDMWVLSWVVILGQIHFLSG